MADHKKAFSLVELLIVIMIISMVYFLGFSSFEKESSQTKALTPLNLKSLLLRSELLQKKGTFICLDKCQHCYVRSDISSPFEAYDHGIDLKGIESYTLDSSSNLQKVDNGRFKDKKICLKMDFYTNGSSTQMILKQKEKVYFLPAFFGEAQEVESLEDAKALWLADQKEVGNSGEFY